MPTTRSKQQSRKQSQAKSRPSAKGVAKTPARGAAQPASNGKMNGKANGKSNGTPRNPRDAGPKPEFRTEMQSPPGHEAQMTPAPDHGESSYRGSGKLTGKVALITGGDSGIGRAVALAFAREGADVVIAYLDEHDDARASASAVEQSGRRAVTVAGDITDEAHCRALVNRTVRELGRLDLLVNNAAMQRTHDDIAEFSSEELERTFRTNIFAMFWLCQAAIPHLAEGSAIINVASIQAFDPSPSLLAYASTKGAIVTFTKAFSKQAIKKGVRVNAIAPGPVWTPLIPSTMPAEQVKSFGQDTPMGRPAQPAELAPPFVFLASDDSRFITGEVIGVTGGEFVT